MRKKLSLQITKSVAGLAICAFGAYLTVVANIGMSPWDALSMAVSCHLPVSYGVASVCISLLVVLADILLHEPIGLSTFFDAFLVGTITDVFLHWDPLPRCYSLGWGALIMCGAMLVISTGQWLYMAAGLGCGPRDALLVGIGKRLRKLPIGVVNALVLVVVIGLGLLLKGPIGIGTAITVCTWSSAMQLVFRIVKFEPRDVSHENVLESVAKWSQKSLQK